MTMTNIDYDLNILNDTGSNTIGSPDFRYETKIVNGLSSSSSSPTSIPMPSSGYHYKIINMTFSNDNDYPVWVYLNLHTNCTLTFRVDSLSSVTVAKETQPIYMEYHSNNANQQDITAYASSGSYINVIYSYLKIAS